MLDAARNQLTFRLRDDCDFEEPEDVRGAASETVLKTMYCSLVCGWRRRGAR